jgi:hypothetical protein
LPVVEKKAIERKHRKISRHEPEVFQIAISINGNASTTSKSGRVANAKGGIVRKLLSINFDAGRRVKRK